MINELHDRLFSCSTSIPDGPAYAKLLNKDRLCAQVGRLTGTSSVSGTEYLRLKYNYVESHLWRNLGILIAMMVVFGVTLLIGTEYIPSQQSRGEVLQFKDQSRSHCQDEETAVSGLEKRVPKLPDSTSHRPEATSAGQSGAVVGVQSASLCSSVFHWQNIYYEVKFKKESRHILKDISGWVQPGSLTALMGPTGAGKTTLLDILSGRAMSGQTSGNVKINNKLRDAGIDSRRRIGYVQQNDIHLPTATVREALQFSALLRQSKAYSRRERLAYVEEVLDILDMTSYAEAVVGIPGEGLNVEQRKRLSIGVEMVARPDVVLFLG